LRNTFKVKVGKIRELRSGSQKAVLSVGAIGTEVMDALSGTSYAHFDVTYLKPIDREALMDIAAKFDEIVTVEENSARGGLGDTVRAVYSENDIKIKVRSVALPDKFIEHGSLAELHQLCGLDAKSILKFIEL
jgi:1-deoxy-D-xylulose-5-phosphate synthase